MKKRIVEKSPDDETESGTEGGEGAGLFIVGIRTIVRIPMAMHATPPCMTNCPSSAAFKVSNWKTVPKRIHDAAPNEKPMGPIALLARAWFGKAWPMRMTTARYVDPTLPPPRKKLRRKALKFKCMRKYPALASAKPQRVVAHAATKCASYRFKKLGQRATPSDRPIDATPKGAKLHASDSFKRRGRWICSVLAAYIVPIPNMLAKPAMPWRRANIGGCGVIMVLR